LVRRCSKKMGGLASFAWRATSLTTGGGRYEFPGAHAFFKLLYSAGMERGDAQLHWGLAKPRPQPPFGHIHVKNALMRGNVACRKSLTDSGYMYISYFWPPVNSGGVSESHCVCAAPVHVVLLREGYFLRFFHITNTRTKKSTTPPTTAKVASSPGKYSLPAAGGRAASAAGLTGMVCYVA
jgi:hypothetical protein